MTETEMLFASGSIVNRGERKYLGAFSELGIFRAVLFHA